jgi:hypothetical protein
MRETHPQLLVLKTRGPWTRECRPGIPPANNKEGTGGLKAELNFANHTKEN